MSSIFSELKRRNVFRVAAAYLVIGWLLAQVVGLAADSFDAPAWVMKMFITILAIGFIPTILFSWAYELTPEGIKKDSDVDSSQSNNAQTSNKLNIVTLVAVLGAVGMFGYQQINPPVVISQEPSQVQSDDIGAVVEATISEEQIEDASIAVLPFADLSPDGDQEYFSDGIAEEILNVLVRVEQLKVASRTSAFGFKGQEALGIPLIAEKLKVRHVLEGSVRKAGDTVRITAQLIDAQTDAHLWSETYDRPLTTENIFAVQDEIAGVIVEQLGLLLAGENEPQPRVKVTTENLDAYELYLKAKGLFHIRSTENLLEIMSLYEQAVSLDPDFAEAWSGLAATYLVMPGWNLGSIETYHPKAESAAGRATELDGDLALPYAIRGSVDSERGEWISSIEQFDEALERDPNDLQSVYFKAGNIFELGYIEEAEAGFRRCLALDPEYQICQRFLAFTMLFQGETKEAIDLFLEGVLAGQQSYLMTFADYYAASRDIDSLVLLLGHIFPDENELRKLRFQYYNDNTFLIEDFNQALNAQLNEKDRFTENFVFNAIAENFPTRFLWSPYLPSLRKPGQRKAYLAFRKQFFIDKGYVEYWRKHSFPPQCRAVGEDDFGCDVLLTDNSTN